MSFKKYNSIKLPKKNILSRIDEFYNLDWVATEKIHGANFQFVCDGVNITCCCRNMVLGQNDNFYNYQKLKKEYEKCVFEIWSMLKKKNSQINTIRIYGELFGGSYPHKDVPKVKNAKQVQNGVYYSPENKFYCFDIYTDQNGYLDFKEFVDMSTIWIVLF